MYTPVMEGHEVYFGLEQSCYVYNTKNGLIQQREEDKLYSRHEEADTRVIYHVDFITKESPDYPTSCDTDVFVILLHHADTIGANLWMHTEVKSKNTRCLNQHFPTSYNTYTTCLPCSASISRVHWV